MSARFPSVPLDVFSIDEVAAVADVRAADVQRLVDAGVVLPFRGFLSASDAVRLVRHFVVGTPAEELARAPLGLVDPRGRRRAPALAGSMVLYAALVLLAVTALTHGWIVASAPAKAAPPRAARLVFLMAPGPGGGGGGGGLEAPAPAPPVKIAAPAPKPRTMSPIPPRVRTPPIRRPERPVRPVPRPRIEPRPPEPPREPPVPTQVVNVPMVSARAEAVDAIGVPAAAPAPPSPGPGTAGGVGSGQGTGTGQGLGTGLGEGRDGGAGGGTFRPGSGVDAPTLLHEVHPVYTDEARRRGIEGDVILDVTVLRDGRVGDVKVRRPLGAGLDQKAVDAVRQWRFSPARRQGDPVDVSVQVAVSFSLR